MLSIIVEAVVLKQRLANSGTSLVWKVSLDFHPNLFQDTFTMREFCIISLAELSVLQNYCFEQIRFHGLDMHRSTRGSDRVG